MADAKKQSTKKLEKPAASKPKDLTDEELAAGLMKVQRRNLSTIDFGAVTRTIKLLSE